MVFSSLVFLFVYFPIVMVVMKLSPLKYRNLILFVVSLVFYGWGEPKYILIMLLSTVVDYFNGYMIDKNKNNRKVAKRFVIFSIVFNLGLLGFFKYFDFFAANLMSLGFTWIHPLGLTLPIGISFYTFQTMSYPIDVYRKDADVQKNIISFGAYVSMFPQLIAGPIVRYKDIAKQLVSRDETADKFYLGIQRFMIGLSKKVLLANSIGLLWESIQVLPQSQMSIVTAWLGAAAFAFQIYFDFSGYSDMAIGLGKMLGFDFLENFNYPYISSSITDFWRRWHISLSSWFRDYVYIPLGGNRKGNLLTYRNIFIVWLLTGFWHGASWNFMLWGIYFGVLLMIEKAFLLKYLKKAPRFLAHIYTLLLVLISWVIFAFIDLDQGVTFLQTMFGLKDIPFVDGLSLFYLRNNIGLLVILVIASTPLFKNLFSKYVMNKKAEWIVPVLVILGLIICTAYIVDATYNPFLYFRF